MKRLMALLAMSSATISPAAASVRDAAFSSSSDREQAQTSMFAGASYRVSLGGRNGNARSRAGLKLSGMMKAPGSSDIRFGQGLEIAGGKTGKPALFIAGRDAGELGERAQLSKGATIALVAVGVVVIAGVAVALAVDERLDRQNTE